MILPQEILKRWPTPDRLSEIITECGGNPSHVTPFVLSARCAILNLEHADYISLSMSVFCLVERLSKCHTFEERATVVEKLLLQFAPEEHQKRLEREFELYGRVVGNPLVLTILPEYDEYLHELTRQEESDLNHSEECSSTECRAKTTTSKRRRTRRQTKVPTGSTSSARTEHHPPPTDDDTCLSDSIDGYQLVDTIVDEVIRPFSVPDSDTVRGVNSLASDFASGLVTPSTFHAAAKVAAVPVSEYTQQNVCKVYTGLTTTGFTRTQIRNIEVVNTSYRVRYRPRWVSILKRNILKIWSYFIDSRPPESLVYREVTESVIKFIDSL